MKRIVFDIEATGLSEAQICQLSYLIVDDSGVVGKNQFFAVDDMNPDAEAVHGFSMEMLEELSGGLRFADLASAIYEEFASANLFIGHNIAADVRYLQMEFARLDMKLPKIPTFCTMNHFTSDVNLKMKVNIGRPKPPKLIELCEYFELTEEGIAAKAQEWFGDGNRHLSVRFGSHPARETARRTLNNSVPFSPLPSVWRGWLGRFLRLCSGLY